MELVNGEPRTKEYIIELINAHIAKGQEFILKNQFSEAEFCFRKILEIDPISHLAHNNIGWTLQMQDNAQTAIVHYQKALELNSKFRLARINLASLLSKLKRVQEARAVWRSLIIDHPEDRQILERIISLNLEAGDLEGAASYADEYAMLCKASSLYNYNDVPVPVPVLSVPTPVPLISINKLQHDIEQFKYLQTKSILNELTPSIIGKYERVLEYHSILDVEKRVELCETDRKLIGETYNRFTYIRNTPRVEQALSQHWDRAQMQNDYLNHPLGLAVIDNFLSEEALSSIRQFCLESTIWFGNRYAYGRLGAFFYEGFNCPLLIQMAEEIKYAFPEIIGDKHPLQQLWAFKYGSNQPMTHAHADFAAVNVNFWITPDEANLDENSGGMNIYDVEAPLHWDFNAYNRQGRKIDELLKEKNARIIKIPYRANRAIIFHSDLFHTTQKVNFLESYENRRINITMLYGNRENT